MAILRGATNITNILLKPSQNRKIVRNTFSSHKFNESFYIVNEATKCWLWQGHIDVCGYGRVSVCGKSTPAHRFVYEKFKEKIPKGVQLDHLCRTRACVNPEHLEPVTGTKNIRRSKVCLLTEEQVIEIRANFSLKRERHVDIANRYNVDRKTICDLLNNKTWRNL